MEETRDIKDTAVMIFKDGAFEPHKWHSNMDELEGEAERDSETTLQRRVLGAKQSELKLLGMYSFDCKGSFQRNM